MIVLSCTNWLVIGREENWLTAFSQPVPLWGLKLKYKNEFNQIKIGDFLWCYITAPISGVIGLSTLMTKI